MIIIIIIYIICANRFMSVLRVEYGMVQWSPAGLIRDCGCGHDCVRRTDEGRCVMFPVQFLMERWRRLLPACVHCAPSSPVFPQLSRCSFVRLSSSLPPPPPPPSSSSRRVFFMVLTPARVY